MLKKCFRQLRPMVCAMPLILVFGLFENAANDWSAKAHPAQLIGGWTAANVLNVARFAHSATLLNDGRVLIAGGRDSANRELKSAEIYDPATGRSTTVGDLNEARSDHHAVALKDGRVLVINKQSAETFNPATGQWTLTGPTTLQNSSTSGSYDRGSVTLLANGKVLVTGGQSGILTFARNGAELFDPATGNWTATGGMNFGRSDHSTTLLPNGKVLAAGGINRQEQPAVTELYDPETGQWTRTGSLRVPRYRHFAAYLPNGRVLVAGGTADLSLTSFTLTSRTAELYDLATGVWGFAEASSSSHLITRGQVAQLSDGRVLFVASGEVYDFNTGRWTFIASQFAGSATLTALPNGKALLTGGRNDRPLRLVQLFDPALRPVQISGQWSLTSSYGAGLDHASTALADGKVLVTGGAVPSVVTGNFLAQSGARVFDPQNGWQTVNNMAVARHRHTVTLLPNGQVLATGGESVTNAALSGAELFSPATNVWNAAGNMGVPRQWHQTVLLANGKVLVAGGSNESGTLSSAELYDPAMDRWTSTGAMNVARRFHTLTVLANGKVLAVGGENNGVATSSAELYDPATGNWRTVASTATARRRHTATRLLNGKVLVTGGENSDSLFNAELFDPATEQWIATGTLWIARHNHSATLLDNGRVLIAGGADSEGPLSSAELFDPMADGGVGAFINTGSLGRRRNLHSAIKLPDGKVLAVSGVTPTTQGTTVTQQVVPEAELFDPTFLYQAFVPPSRFAAVSASSYRGGDLASGSIIAIFGEGFSDVTAVANTTPLPTTLAGARVIITRTDLSPPLPLFFVSPNQINAQLLNSLNNTMPLGMITLTVTTSDGRTIQEPLYVAPVAPGVFSADSSGRGVAAAVAFRIKANGEQVYEPIARFDPAQNRVVAVPLDLSNQNELVFLILYGTGWRSRSSLSAVTASVGGSAVEVTYAGQQNDFVGLDQANLRLPNTLAGRGEVEVRLTVDGIAANPVTVVVK
jgi:uncharacterized protein (TIGR03437 family)